MIYIRGTWMNDNELRTIILKMRKPRKCEARSAAYLLSFAKVSSLSDVGSLTIHVIENDLDDFYNIFTKVNIPADRRVKIHQVSHNTFTFRFHSSINKKYIKYIRCKCISFICMSVSADECIIMERSLLVSVT